MHQFIAITWIRNIQMSNESHLLIWHKIRRLNQLQRLRTYMQY